MTNFTFLRKCHFGKSILKASRLKNGVIPKTLVPFELGSDLAMHAAFKGQGLLRTVVLVPWAVLTVVSAITWRTVVPTDWSGIDRPALGLLLAPQTGEEFRRAVVGESAVPARRPGASAGSGPRLTMNERLPSRRPANHRTATPDVATKKQPGRRNLPENGGER